jgi:hypothetical protein
MFSNNDLFAVIGVIAGAAALLASIMAFLAQQRQSKYDEKLHRIELDIVRKSMESQLYSLNAKLMATEARWKDVNHLLISSQNHQLDSNFSGRLQLTPFLQSAGIVDKDLAVDRDLVFVLIPFHDRYSALFDVISTACRDLGLKALRGDEDYIEGDVFGHVLRLIVKARLIIACIEGRNPNVYYELGIAHGLGKQTILVSQADEEAPFDLKTKKLVLYSLLEELPTRLKDEVARSLAGQSSKVFQ